MIAVWKRNYLYFKKTWLVSAFWIFLEPLIYLGAIGYGLGSYVDRINGQIYVEFFFPALVATTGMLISYFESTYSSYTKLTYQKTFSTIILTPISADEVIKGEILWATTKGVLSSLGVMIIGGFLGLCSWFAILECLPILFVHTWVFSAFGMNVTAWAKNYDSFVYATSGVIVPMSLLSGTYFPLSQLPSWLESLAFTFPLTHSVMATRSLMSGAVTGGVIINIVYLVLVGSLLQFLAIRRLVCGSSLRDGA